jgi:hypothetical protein
MGRSNYFATYTALMPVIAYGNIPRIRALFDQGSQRTFILRKTSKELLKF